MKKVFVILFFLEVLIKTGPTSAQNCSQKLVDATRAYYNGQFREAESTLEGCLDQLSGDEKVDAYKLLTDTYLILGESGQADMHMSELLMADPGFEPRESDLVEFRQLFETYEIRSKHTIGLVMGIQRPDYVIMRHQSLVARTEEPSDYDEKLGFLAGITGDYRLYRNLYLSGSLTVDWKNFQQEEVLLDFQRVATDEWETRVSLPLQVKYLLPNFKVKPFVGTGISVQYFLKASADIDHFPCQH